MWNEQPVFITGYLFLKSMYFALLSSLVFLVCTTIYCGTNSPLKLELGVKMELTQKN